MTPLTPSQPGKHSNSPAVKQQPFFTYVWAADNYKPRPESGDIIGMFRHADEPGDMAGALAVFEGLELGPSGSSGWIVNIAFFTFTDIEYFAREFVAAPALRVDLEDTW